MVGWLRRLCGGWVRNAGNKAQLRPAGAGALPELGKNLTLQNKIKYGEQKKRKIMRRTKLEKNKQQKKNEK